MPRRCQITHEDIGLLFKQFGLSITCSVKRAVRSSQYDSNDFLNEHQKLGAPGSLLQLSHKLWRNRPLIRDRKKSDAGTSASFLRRVKHFVLNYSTS